jgi:2-polyprenyl-6-methoxyphenol hydroxylase-like FAD-dependent oxidoreductase
MYQGLCHEHTLVIGCDSMHSVLRRAVQQRVNKGMCTVSARRSNRYVGNGWRHKLHSVRRRPI